MTACEFCGDEAAHEHHIVPQRFGGPDTDENLLPVCASCHQTLENAYDERFFSWFGISDESEYRWRYKSCSFPDCDQGADRLVVIAGAVIDRYGAVEAVPNDRKQPVCDACLTESVELIQENLNRSTSEQAIQREVDRRTVEMEE
jgi:hypothetical protein